GRHFGSAVSLGWQKSVLSAYFSISNLSVGQVLMLMLCCACFVSLADKLRTICNTSVVQNAGRQFGSAVSVAGKNWYLCVSVSVFIVFRNSLHSSLLWHWRKVI